MEISKVNFDGFEYPIKMGAGIAKDVVNYIGENTKNKKVLVVIDEHLEEYSWPGIIGNPLKDNDYDIYMVYMRGGKINKTLEVVTELYTILEENKFARDSTIVAVGGGVIGDLAGFVASTWFRGMNLIHIPTTLTAMIDSSVGGKVAINFKDTINAVGNYHHPICNIIDLKFLETLPEREYNAGMAEIIKCAMISDKHLFKYIVENVDGIRARHEDKVLHLINNTIQIKIDHVTNDVRETGKRLLLNYGHTLGHAIEMTTMNGTEEKYRHGEGVAIGMVAAAYIAEKFLGTYQSVGEQLKHVLKLYDLPIRAISSDDIYRECLEIVTLDKKRKDNQLRLILVDEIGSAGIYKDVPFDLIKNAFNEVIGYEPDYGI